MTVVHVGNPVAREAYKETGIDGREITLFRGDPG